MEYRTPDGIEFFILPDNAKCRYAGTHPDRMETCPLCRFDRFGDVCIPEECGHYSEDELLEE